MMGISIYKKYLRCKYCKHVIYASSLPKLCSMCNHDPRMKKQYLNSPKKRVWGYGKGPVWLLNIKCEICKKRRATLIKQTKYLCKNCV